MNGMGDLQSKVLNFCKWEQSKGKGENRVGQMGSEDTDLDQKPALNVCEVE